MRVENLLSVITLCFWSGLARGVCVNGGYYIKQYSNKHLEGCVVERCDVGSVSECGIKCNKLQPICKSFSYVKDISGDTSDVCELNNCAAAEAKKKTQLVDQANTHYYEMISIVKPKPPVDISSYTDGDWVLIARFSNADETHWIDDQDWWYDRQVHYGLVHDPAHNGDMIAPAFWSKQATELKITRSDDDYHQALLVTDKGCLAGGTFRERVTNIGVSHGKTRWVKNDCRNDCTVRYGAGYRNTAGFAKSTCRGDGKWDRRNKISFWCHSDRGASVMMIGSGGKSCSRADHGIGITEKKHGHAPTNGYDFGDDAVGRPVKSYSLNLWVH